MPTVSLRLAPHGLATKNLATGYESFLATSAWISDETPAAVPRALMF